MTSCNCGRKWTGLIECHCRSCHRHFSSVAPFDAHRRGGECSDPAEMTRRDGSPAMLCLDRASGPTWALWFDQDRQSPYAGKKSEPLAASPRVDVPESTSEVPS